MCGVEELERFEKLEKEVLDVTFRKDLRERREKMRTWLEEMIRSKSHSYN